MKSISIQKKSLHPNFQKLDHPTGRFVVELLVGAFVPAQFAMFLVVLPA
jgi:hypothetical protein